MNDHRSEWKTQFQDGSIQTIRDILSHDPSLVSERVDCTLKSGSVREWGPLFVAANHLCDFAKVQALVEAGASLDNSDLGTHWPSEDVAINVCLIERGIDVNQPSYLGFHAIGVSDLDTFYLMLENGLDPNRPWPYNGETPLHVQARHDDDTHLARAYSLIKAGRNVNAQALSGLDDEPITNNEHFIHYGKETPLHFAARLGTPRQARLLLDHGANPELKTVSRRAEPEAFEPWEGEVTSLTWPLREFKRIVFEPYEGETPLEMAVRTGNDRVAELLREGSHHSR